MPPYLLGIGMEGFFLMKINENLDRFLVKENSISFSYGDCGLRNVTLF